MTRPDMLLMGVPCEASGALPQHGTSRCRVPRPWLEQRVPTRIPHDVLVSQRGKEGGGVWENGHISKETSNMVNSGNLSLDNSFKSKATVDIKFSFLTKVNKITFCPEVTVTSFERGTWDTSFTVQEGL